MFGYGLQIKNLRIEPFRASSSYKHIKLDAYSLKKRIKTLSKAPLVKALLKN